MARNKVVIEITEHGDLSAQAIRQIEKLNSHGYLFFLDDCEDEYLLSCLADKLPLTGVKVGFKKTINLETNQHIAQLSVAKIFRKAARLNIPFRVAEGTINDLQMATLCDLGATHAQGFKWPKCKLQQSLRELDRDYL